MQPCLQAERQGTLTALKAERAHAAAGLRTSAAHAWWEEIGLGDVAPVIELMKELSGRILDKEPPPAVPLQSIGDHIEYNLGSGEHQISSAH
jgi:hypothetical protein